MKTNQTASNRFYPPAIAGVSTGGIGSGLFDTQMEHQELFERLGQIIQSQADLEALASLITERRDHLFYRAADKEFYFGEKPQPEGVK